ncbi:MAG: hypothetical protein LUG44_02550 [Clostridiales bacterium]|nr:hypothetical protein [Clostridiales bacterium]
MNLTKQEQETIIRFDEAEATASVFTFNRALLNKLEKLTTERPDDCKLEREFPSGAVEYTVPKRWVKITPPRRLSAEQLEAMRERGRKIGFQARDTANKPGATT